MLDPHQLKVFIAAAEELNFTRAARQLHMSQPSVTQHIRALEAHFGVPLFNRKGRRLELSEAGMALLPLARQLITVANRTDEVMELVRGDIHGSLTIACSTTPGKYILPVLLADFMRLHPRVSATCNVTPRPQALQMLTSGEVNFALSSDPQEFDSNVEFQHVLSDRVLLLAPADHPWARRGKIGVQELRYAPFVVREESAGTFRVVRAALARRGINISDLRVVLRLGNSEAIAIAVQEGLGVGFVSSTVVHHVANDRRAVVIAIDDFDVHQDIYIGRHKLLPDSRIQNAFWDYLKNEGAEQVRALQKRYNFDCQPTNHQG